MFVYNDQVFVVILYTIKLTIKKLKNNETTVHE